MGDPPQDPYSSTPPPGGPPPTGGPRPPHGWQQPGQPPAEPYPGYADTHADHYRRQQEAAQQAAQQAAIGPQVSANPLRHLGNGGMPPPRPGLSPEEQQAYDGAKKILRTKILRLAILVAMLGIAGILGLIRTFA